MKNALVPILVAAVMLLGASACKTSSSLIGPDKLKGKAQRISDYSYRVTLVNGKEEKKPFCYKKEVTDFDRKGRSVKGYSYYYYDSTFVGPDRNYKTDSFKLEKQGSWELHSY